MYKQKFKKYQLVKIKDKDEQHGYVYGVLYNQYSNTSWEVEVLISSKSDNPTYNRRVSIVPEDVMYPLEESNSNSIIELLNSMLPERVNIENIHNAETFKDTGYTQQEILQLLIKQANFINRLEELVLNKENYDKGSTDEVEDSSELVEPVSEELNPTYTITGLTEDRLKQILSEERTNLEEL